MGILRKCNTRKHKIVFKHNRFSFPINRKIKADQIKMMKPFVNRFSNSFCRFIARKLNALKAKAIRFISIGIKNGTHKATRCIYTYNV